ncbi:MAG: hypothetical protein HC767_01315 [Akkermansiaceae bacterium]|nr:hypothetical protein [Akkermansiaceae bacterium]
MLVMFYVGQGCLKDGKPHAIATDGTPVNLQLHFLSALNRMDPEGAHSIVLLMDSCLAARKPAQHRAGCEGTDHTSRSSIHQGNLIIFSHSYQAMHALEKDAIERCVPGAWTHALLQSMTLEDDVLCILEHAASQMHGQQHIFNNAQKPWAFYKSGVHSSCSLARCAAA